MPGGTACRFVRTGLTKGRRAVRKGFCMRVGPVPEVPRSMAAAHLSLADAQLMAYPTAIGSEPDHPEFDTLPLSRNAIVGQAVTNRLLWPYRTVVATRAP